MKTLFLTLIVLMAVSAVLGFSWVLGWTNASVDVIHDTVEGNAPKQLVRARENRLLQEQYDQLVNATVVTRMGRYKLDQVEDELADLDEKIAGHMKALERTRQMLDSADTIFRIDGKDISRDELLRDLKKRMNIVEHLRSTREMMAEALARQEGTLAQQEEAIREARAEYQRIILEIQASRQQEDILDSLAVVRGTNQPDLGRLTSIRDRQNARVMKKRVKAEASNVSDVTLLQMEREEDAMARLEAMLDGPVPAETDHPASPPDQ